MLRKDSTIGYAGRLAAARDSLGVLRRNLDSEDFDESSSSLGLTQIPENERATCTKSQPHHLWLKKKEREETLSKYEEQKKRGKSLTTGQFHSVQFKKN